MTDPTAPTLPGLAAGAAPTITVDHVSKWYRDVVAVSDVSFGVAPGVIVSDSFGRPWRNGIVNVAIGVAGLGPLADYRGRFDDAGYELHVTVIAVADELACAAELVSNKLDKRPVTLIRGYRPPVSLPPGTAQDLVIDPARDMFR